MVLGYSFTALNYLLHCISRFCKKKYQMLIFDLAAKIAFILGLYFMGSMGGALSIVVNFFYLILGTIKETKGYKWPALYAFFQLLLLLVLIKTFVGISSILVFMSTSITLFAIWWMPPQKMRVLGIVTNVITLVYQLSIQNWAGLCELAVITSNTVSYVKYRKGEKA